jgi:hypothetical protein
MPAGFTRTLRGSGNLATMALRDTRAMPASGGSAETAAGASGLGAPVGSALLKAAALAAGVGSSGCRGRAAVLGSKTLSGPLSFLNNRLSRRNMYRPPNFYTGSSCSSTKFNCLRTRDLHYIRHVDRIGGGNRSWRRDCGAIFRLVDLSDLRQYRQSCRISWTS